MTKNEIRETLKRYTMKNLGMTGEELESLDSQTFGIREDVKDKFEHLVRSSDHITVLGDYDCDGVTSTYIMSKLMTSTFHKDADFLIPNRFSDGYGIQKKLIDRIYEKEKPFLDAGKTCTIITVDNGIAGAEPIAYAKSLGFTVIVTDHHELGNNEIPKADLVIDPKVPEVNPFDYDGYCGAGVAYKIAEQFVKNPKFVRHLRAFAALGTVADVMDLTGDNRKIVKQALSELSSGILPIPFKRLGEAYNELHEFEWEDLTEKDFGFLFGPVVNASSRMSDTGATFAENFFLHPTRDGAKQMVQTNEERKELTKALSTSVETQVAEHGIKSPLWVYVPNTKEGIIGILAGKLTEKFGVPCIVLTDTEDKTLLKGSARSIPGFNIFEYLQSLPQDIFAAYGGHTGAAGLSIYREKYKDVENLPDLGVHAECGHLVPDLVVTQDELPMVWDAEREFAPFGQGNPAPEVGVILNPAEKPPRMCGQDKNTAIYFGDDRTDVPAKVTIFRYDGMMGERERNTPYLAVGELNTERFRGQKSISLIADEIEDVPERERAKTMRYNS